MKRQFFVVLVILLTLAVTTQAQSTDKSLLDRFIVANNASLDADAAWMSITANDFLSRFIAANNASLRDDALISADAEDCLSRFIAVNNASLIDDTWITADYAVDNVAVAASIEQDD